MSRARIFLFDTTLRDGAQTQGVDFSVEDKRQIALALDAFGLDYIEGGWPGANPTDTAFFAQELPLKHARRVAFGMTKRAGRSAGNDPGLASVLDAKAAACCLVGKSWDYHVDKVLEVPREENLDAIRESMQEVARRAREPMFDAEHFFDGYKSNADYAVACLKAALDGGARWIVLCDTNGGTLPHEVERIVGEVVDYFGGDVAVGVHLHDDTGCGVANALAGVRGGATQVQGTINGYGERTGNCNLTTIIPNLTIKMGVETIPADRLELLTPVSHHIAELVNMAVNPQAPYVGTSAFAHKAGLHVSAIARRPDAYEHIVPDSVGNGTRFVVSELAGKATVALKATKLGLDLDGPTVNQVVDTLKRLEHEGYHFEVADASLELLMRRATGWRQPWFEVESFRVITDDVQGADGIAGVATEATIKVRLGTERLIATAEGNGPVNALDNALRKDLGRFSKWLEDLRLVDYKVRILTGGTEAVTRVMIESADETGHRWSTVGVSANIVDASFEALIDSITYKLLQDRVQVSGGRT